MGGGGGNVLLHDGQSTGKSAQILFKLRHGLTRGREM